MEFTARTDYIPPAQLRRFFTLETLEEWSDSLILLDEVNEDRVAIGGIWGEFTLQRTELSVGVRFALLECPYALSWTISAPPEGETQVQFQVNRDQVCSQFHSEVDEVLEEMRSALENLLSNPAEAVSDTAPAPSACSVRY